MKNLLLAILILAGASLSAQGTQFKAYVQSSFFNVGPGLCDVYIQEGDCASGIMITQGGEIIWTITELGCGISVSELDEAYLNVARYVSNANGKVYLSNVQLMPLYPFQYWEQNETSLIREFKFESILYFVKIDIQPKLSDGKKI